MANTKRSTGAKRKPQPKQQAAGGSRIGWFLSGLLPGLFVAFLVHMHHDRDGSAISSSPSGDIAQEGSESTGERNRPRFEFYELLSEMEVVVPDDPDDDDDEAPAAVPEAPAAPTPETAAPEPVPEEDAVDEDDAHYMVQAGSFQSHDDADRMKANLALIGVQANIESVEVDSGETWHRVRIGPFADRDRVDSLRSQLEDNNVDSILLRSRS